MKSLMPVGSLVYVRRTREGFVDSKEHPYIILGYEYLEPTDAEHPWLDITFLGTKAVSTIRMSEEMLREHIVQTCAD